MIRLGVFESENVLPDMPPMKAVLKGKTMKNLIAITSFVVVSAAMADTHTVNVSSGLFTRATNSSGITANLSVNARRVMSETYEDTSGSAFFTMSSNQLGSSGSRTVRLTDVHSVWHRDGVAILEGRGTYRVTQNFTTLQWNGNVRIIVNDQKEPGFTSPNRDRYTIRFFGDSGQGFLFDGFVTSGDLRVTETVNEN